MKTTMNKRLLSCGLMIVLFLLGTINVYASNKTEKETVMQPRTSYVCLQHFDHREYASGGGIWIDYSKTYVVSPNGTYPSGSHPCWTNLGGLHSICPYGGVGTK